MKKELLTIIINLVLLPSFSQEGSKTLLYSIQTSDCVNCYLNIKNVFHKYNGKHDYKIILNDISDENVIGFINKNLSFSPSIKKIEINNDSFTKYSSNFSSTFVVLDDGKIVYQNLFKNIDQQEFSKIDKLLTSNTFGNFNNIYPKNVITTNLINYTGSRFYNPLSISDNIYVFNNLNNILYRINQNKSEEFINLNKDISDSLIKSIFKSADYFSDSNKTYILNSFDDTKKTMNRTFEVDNIFNSKDYIYVSTRVYISLNMGNNVQGIIYPTVIFKYNIRGEMVAYYDFKWALDSETTTFLYFYEVDVLDNDRLIVQKISFKDTFNSLVEVDLRNKDYRNPVREILKFKVPKPLQNSKLGNMRINFFRKIDFAGKSYYYNNLIPKLYDGKNSNEILLKGIKFDSIQNIFITKILPRTDFMELHYIDNVNNITKVNLYNRNFDLVTSRELYNFPAYYVKQDQYFKFIPSKELFILNYEIKK